MMMDSWSPQKQGVLAAVAGVGLLAALCLVVMAALAIGAVGLRGQSAGRQVDVVDRIAYIGSDGNLYMMDRNGENVEYLAVGDESTAFAHPTWSPDGSRVAFIAQRRAGAGLESILYTVSTVGGDPTTVYRSTTNPAFYLYWSPDSRTITFLTQEDSSIALRMAAADGSQAARVLERGAPLYWSWSPDGEEMFMHIGGARSSNQEARLAIVAREPESAPDVLNEAPANFQAPAWSPDGSRLLYVGESEDGGQALYTRMRRSGALHKIVDIRGWVRFNGSPDGQWIAYQQIEDARMVPLGHVFLVSATERGGAARRLTRDPALAFFWSPDGRRLAILVPSLGEEEPTTRGPGLAAPTAQAGELLLRWWLVDIPDGRLRPLVAFPPTRSFLLVIPYFDQYAQSIRFWSPDSRYLVYSSQESEQRAGIWVADVEGRESPRRLGDGVLAVWSWQ